MKLHVSRVLALTLMLLLVFVYARDAMRSNSDVRILQTPVRDLTPELLRARYPVVIQESIVEPVSLLRTAFKYQFVSSRAAKFTGEYMNARPRYAVMYTTGVSDGQEDKRAQVDVYSPKGDEFVSVLLRSHQCLILPSRWSLKTTAEMQVIELYDLWTTFA
jgi:hypothetical protein